MIQLNHTYSFMFTAYEGGEPATTTPTLILYRNGSASMQPIVVTPGAATGVFTATFSTLSGWAVTDHLQVLATIDGNPDVVWDSLAIQEAPIIAPDNTGISDTLTAVQARPSVEAIASQVRTELAAELARIDENISDPKTLTAQVFGDLFSDTDAATALAQQLSDVITGISGLLDESSDAAPQVIAGLVLSLLKDDPTYLEIQADTEASRLAAVANNTLLANLPTPLTATETQNEVSAALVAYDSPTRSEATQDKDEVLLAVSSIEGGSGGGSVDEEELGDYLVSRVLSVRSQIPESDSCIRRIEGDTWTVSISDLGDLTGVNLVASLKESSTDSDADSLLLISESGGLEIVNGEAAGTATLASLVPDSDRTTGNATLVVSSLATATIEPSYNRSYSLTIKVLSSSEDSTRSVLLFDVSPGGVDRTTD